MNVLKVDGLPLAKLKEKYLVLILKSKAEFEQLLVDSSEPVFCDQQKAYCIKGKNCFVFFHNSAKAVDEWVRAYGEH